MTKDEENQENKSIIIGAQPMEAKFSEALAAAKESQAAPQNTKALIQLPPYFKCTRCRQNQWFITEFNQPLAQFWIRCAMCEQWVVALGDAPYEEVEEQQEP